MVFFSFLFVCRQWHRLLANKTIKLLGVARCRLFNSTKTIHHNYFNFDSPIMSSHRHMQQHPFAVILLYLRINSKIQAQEIIHIRKQIIAYGSHIFLHTKFFVFFSINEMKIWNEVYDSGVLYMKCAYKHSPTGP